MKDEPRHTVDRERTFDAQSAQLSEMMVVQMSVDAEQTPHDGFDCSVEGSWEWYACMSRISKL